MTRRRGYQRIHFAPQMVRDLIPVGSDADIVLSKFNLTLVEIREGGKLLFKDGQLQPGVAGIASVKEAEKTVTIEAGSGHSVFELTGR